MQFKATQIQSELRPSIFFRMLKHKIFKEFRFTHCIGFMSTRCVCYFNTAADNVKMSSAKKKKHQNNQPTTTIISKKNVTVTINYQCIRIQSAKTLKTYSEKKNNEIGTSNLNLIFWHCVFSLIYVSLFSHFTL